MWPRAVPSASRRHPPRSRRRRRIARRRAGRRCPFVHRCWEARQEARRALLQQRRRLHTHPVRPCRPRRQPRFLPGARPRLRHARRCRCVPVRCYQDLHAHPRRLRQTNRSIHRRLFRPGRDGRRCPRDVSDRRWVHLLGPPPARLPRDLPCHPGRERLDGRWPGSPPCVR
jgi:hypothetical protein